MCLLILQKKLKFVIQSGSDGPFGTKSFKQCVHFLLQYVIYIFLAVAYRVCSNEGVNSYLEDNHAHVGNSQIQRHSFVILEKSRTKMTSQFC